MLSQFRIWLWGMVAELEYKLYPWKTSTPPAWAAERYGADTNTIHDDHEFNYESLHYDWLKSHDDKINPVVNPIRYCFILFSCYYIKYY